MRRVVLIVVFLLCNIVITIGADRLAERANPTPARSYEFEMTWNFDDGECNLIHPENVDQSARDTREYTDDDYTEMNEGGSIECGVNWGNVDGFEDYIFHFQYAMMVIEVADLQENDNISFSLLRNGETLFSSFPTKSVLEQLNEGKDYYIVWNENMSNINTKFCDTLGQSWDYSIDANGYVLRSKNNSVSCIDVWRELEEIVFLTHDEISELSVLIQWSGESSLKLYSGGWISGINDDNPVQEIYASFLMKTQRDTDEDGIIDLLEVDLDNDGIENLLDDFPYDGNESVDTDEDGYGDNMDWDDDDDGWGDIEESNCGTDPLDRNSTPSDDDGDEICNLMDFDKDNDGWTDIEESDCGTDPLDGESIPGDVDADNVCNLLDFDNDNDGWTDQEEENCDTDPFYNYSYCDDEGLVKYLSTTILVAIASGALILVLSVSFILRRANHGLSRVDSVPEKKVENSAMEDYVQQMIAMGHPEEYARNYVMQFADQFELQSKNQ